jgi:hypothetical protein
MANTIPVASQSTLQQITRPPNDHPMLISLRAKSAFSITSARARIGCPVCEVILEMDSRQKDGK